MLVIFLCDIHYNVNYKFDFTGYIHENGSLNMARFERYMTALAEVTMNTDQYQLYNAAAVIPF